MTHTPTPWHAPGMGEIHDADHNLIAHIAFSTGEHDDDQVGTEDDAKFIVRACNSHDQLVESVKALLSCMSLAGWEDDYAAVQARVALSLAGE